jgi:hypothetical protein
MAVSIYQKPIVKNARVQSLILDNASDINSLPNSKTTNGLDEIGLLCQGSTAFIIATGQVYMLNSSDIWVLV